MRELPLQNGVVHEAVLEQDARFLHIMPGLLHWLTHGYKYIVVPEAFLSQPGFPIQLDPVPLPSYWSAQVKLTREDWYRRGHNWRQSLMRDKRSTSFEAECAMISFSLSATARLDPVLKKSAAVLCPEKDLGTLSIPNEEITRLLMLKMDFVHMLSRRVFSQ